MNDMIYTILSLIGFVLGVYAGKRRAKGYTWRMIADDMWFHVSNALARAWNGIMSIFRRDKDAPDAD